MDEQSIKKLPSKAARGTFIADRRPPTFDDGIFPQQVISSVAHVTMWVWAGMFSPGFSWGGDVIDVTAWIIDGGAFQLHHCGADAFLIAATAGARLNASAFVVSHASAAGILLSSGEVTMRASVNQECAVNCSYCRFDMQVAVSVCLPVSVIAFLPLR